MENTLSDETIRFIEKFQLVIKKYSTLENEKKTYGTAHELSKSEIHTIESIGKNSESTITWLAKQHGVSKAAVLKIVKRLEKKGLLTRYQKPDNKKEILYNLTGPGQTAFSAHEEYHKTTYRILLNYIESIDGDLKKEFTTVLEKLLDFADDRENKL